MSDRLAQLAQGALEASSQASAGFGLDGLVGDAICAAELARDGARAEATPGAYVSRAVDAFNAEGAAPSLHGGLAGLGFVIAAYSGGDDALLDDLDHALLDHLPHLPPASLQSGVAGIGLYASLRSESPSGRALQRAVVETLRAAAIPTRAGFVWPTPADYARARGLEVLGEPVVEFGILHGIAGTLVALAALAAQGHEDAAGMVREGLWAAWERERPPPNRFGWVTFGDDGGSVAFSLGSTPARWCVGDPGALRGLWLAADAIGERDAAARALGALRADAAEIAKARSPTGEMNLCCGHSATAQVYLRMHEATGDEIFRDANRKLLESCEAAVAGIEPPNFRYGRLGVIMALLAARGDGAGRWDGILGMSLPRASTPGPSA